MEIQKILFHASPQGRARDSAVALTHIPGPNFYGSQKTYRIEVKKKKKGK